MQLQTTFYSGNNLNIDFQKLGDEILTKALAKKKQKEDKSSKGHLLGDYGAQEQVFTSLALSRRSNTFNQIYEKILICH